MKLLLTSAGFMNSLIVNEFKELLSKPVSESNILYVPTAADAESGHKDWLIEDINRTYDLGFKEFDMMSINGLPINILRSRFEHADVIMVGGGNTSHLIDSIFKSGVGQFIGELLEERVYVGISAGAMIFPNRLNLREIGKLYSEKYKGPEVTDALGFLDFQVIPHYKNKYFTGITVRNVHSYADALLEKVYLLDDDSAVVVDGDKVEVVSEGKWEVFN